MKLTLSQLLSLLLQSVVVREQIAPGSTHAPHRLCSNDHEIPLEEMFNLPRQYYMWENAVSDIKDRYIKNRMSISLDEMKSNSLKAI